MGSTSRSAFDCPAIPLSSFYPCIYLLKLHQLEIVWNGYVFVVIDQRDWYRHRVRRKRNEIDLLVPFRSSHPQRCPYRCPSHLPIHVYHTCYKYSVCLRLVKHHMLQRPYRMLDDHLPSCRDEFVGHVSGRPFVWLSQYYYFVAEHLHGLILISYSNQFL